MNMTKNNFLSYFLIISGCLLPSLTLLQSASAQAAEPIRYVSDVLIINMRSGPTNEYRIIKRLKSGSELTVLGQSSNKKFTQVRTNKGLTGWVLSQYLVKQKSAKQQLAEAKKTIAMLSEDAGPMLKDIENTKALNNRLRKENAQLTAQNQQIQAEIKQIKALSANAIAISQSNKELGQSNQLLRSEIDVLSADNKRLKDNSDIDWFINGAGAVGFGVLLALLIPRLMPRKRQKDW